MQQSTCWKLSRLRILRMTLPWLTRTLSLQVVGAAWMQGSPLLDVISTYWQLVRVTIFVADPKTDLPRVPCVFPMISIRATEQLTRLRPGSIGSLLRQTWSFSPAVGQQYEYRTPLEGQHGNWDFKVWNVWNWKEDDSIWLKSEEFWMRCFDEFSGTLGYPGLILVMLLPCSSRRSSPMNIEKRWRGVPTGLWMMT